MFLHSRTVQVRTVVAGLGLLQGGLLVLINPISNWSDYASNPSGHWFAFFVVLVPLGVLAYLWHIAPTLPQPPLPDPAKWTEPNRIPVGTRLMNVAASAVLLGYGTYGLYVDDIVLPVKGRDGLHLTGASAWFMYAAILCAVANLLAVVADHYDRRNNERGYAHFAIATQWLGWGLFCLALGWRFATR